MDDFNSLTDRIECLGKQLEDAYHRCNYDEAILPTLAVDLLEEIHVEPEFEPCSIAKFFTQSRVLQQTKHRFSDLPITIYRHQDFYIEILVWTHSTTCVHQHSFAGAFKVMRGSSLHSRFRFESHHRVTADFHLGELIREHTEFLPLGAVRPIAAGNEGLIHSLFHLEQPSMTLVVRSPGHQLHLPQLSYYRPGIAVNPSHYEKDSLTTMMHRLLEVACHVDSASLLPLWMEYLERLDYPRLAYLMLTNSHPSSNESILQQVLDAARKIHGDLADALEKSLKAQRRLRTLSDCRIDLQDPDLRFFLAVLMNVADREAVMHLLKQRYPDADAMDTCSELLARLSISKAAMNRALAEALSTARSPSLLLGSKLGVALPDNANVEDTQLLFRQFLEGPGSWYSPSKCSHLDRQQVESFFRRLMSLDLLDCLN